ncbi:MAG TPA: peptidylprolyl isomerase [Anaerovoracaceae bacterium]|nr:peptidylprolyl isomerase [Anaerovoracaceae bacterium]
MKKIIVVMLLIVMTMGLAACSGGGNSGDLVKVGETTIDENQLQQYLDFNVFVQGYDLTQFPEETVKQIKAQMLEDMIAMELIRQYYAGKEGEVLPATIEDDLKSFLDETKKEGTIKDFVDEKKISDEMLTKFFYDQYYRSAFFDEMQKGMTTLDQDAQAYYEANKAEFAVDEVTASHILVADEKTANEVKAKLDAGEKFEDLAAEYGTDNTKDTGGSLGTFGRGQMVKEFEDAAFAMQPGEISSPVKSQFGYHIIKVTDKNQGTRTYDEVKATIDSTLVRQEAQKKVDELKKAADVEYLTDEYPEPEAAG